jgi:pimeloyl-ACP methyl ester carboxylesterase
VLSVSTVDLSYRRRGSGEPLLLVHGTGSNLRAWAPVFDLLGPPPGGRARTFRWGTGDRTAGDGRVGHEGPPAPAMAGAPGGELPPRTRFVSLPGCGHVPMHDDPDLIASVLL